MPVNEKLMANLLKEYGPKKGKNVYYGMEAKGKIKGVHSVKKPKK